MRPRNAIVVTTDINLPEALQAHPDCLPLKVPADLQTDLTQTWLYHYDALLFLAPQQSASLWRKSLDLPPEALQQLRRQACLTQPFRLRWINTRATGADYALAVYFALHSLNNTADALTHKLEQFCHHLEHLFATLAPTARDLRQHPLPIRLKHRLLPRPVNSRYLGGKLVESERLSADTVFERLFDRAIKQLQMNDDRFQRVMLGYSGERDGIKQINGFDLLHQAAHQAGASVSLVRLNRPTEGDQLSIAMAQKDMTTTVPVLP